MLKLIDFLSGRSRKNLISSGLISKEEIDQFLKLRHKKAREELTFDGWRALMEEPPSSTYRIVFGRKRLSSH